MKKPIRFLYPALMVFVMFSLVAAAQGATWSVVENGEELRLHYGSIASNPQYAVLHRNSGYFRIIPGTLAGWGTSVVLPPSFWSGGQYYQGTAVTAIWQVVGPDLRLQINGIRLGLTSNLTLTISPPRGDTISARVDASTTGTVSLDNRPGEAFKPVLLSSMHISSTQWDAQSAFAGAQTYSIPTSGWLIGPQPLVNSNLFGLNGGTSDWKRNSPTITIQLDQPQQIAGWVTASSDPNDDNVGLWGATDAVLASWGYMITSSINLRKCCLPLVIK